MDSVLFDHLQKFNTNPYLFVGSGLSRRYLGLPTWEDLLLKFFKSSGIVGEFEYYQSKTDCDLPSIASSLADEFFDIWWKSPEYKTSRDSFKSIAKAGKNVPLKIELANILRQHQQVSKSYEREIKMLSTSVIDGIITTNWDNFLEQIFVDFNVYIGQQELLFSESISIGELYKIHGCISRPQSLIVTQSDYHDFNNRNAYLAAKLLTIFVEHPIIFLGYSLSDPNILQIVDSIVRCVESNNINKLKDRLIFVEWEPGKNFEIKDSSLMLPDNKVLPIKLIRTDSFEPIFDTLSTLKRQIPVKILRKLKNAVVEFVKSNSPVSRIFVKDIDSITEDTKIEYAVGVGIASSLLSFQGYKGIDIIDIVEDVLYDNKKFDSKQLIIHTFPKLIKSNGFFPIYKYLKAEGLITKNGTLNQNLVSKLDSKFVIRTNVPQCFSPHSYMKKQPEIRRNHKDVMSIVNAYDREHTLIYIPLLEIKSIDLQQLLKHLRDCFKDDKIKKTTNFRKLVCLYDFLKYCI